MKKIIKGLIATMIVVFSLGIISFSSEARTPKTYVEKPILSVLGDSISSYYGYNEISYYAPSGVSGVAYNINKNNMWWSIYTQDSDVSFGWDGAASNAHITLSEDDYLSFFYPRRINSLDNNGVPDYIVLYGGINDIGHDKSEPALYSRYNQLVKKLHSLFDCVKLILIAPNYLPSSMDPTSARNAIVDTFDSYVNIVADSYSDYYVDLRDKYGNADTVDGLHPKESGMRKIALAIEEALANARGTTGIDSIRANLDYDHYIIKINAYDPNYDSLNFKFKLTNSKNEEVIYDTDWQKSNCFYLDEVDTNATYVAYAEIDNDGDGVAEASLERSISNLVAKRSGGTVYNGVDYANVYDFNYYIDHYGDLYNAYRNDPNAAIEHFVNFGMSEGRQAKSDFDVYSYRNQWADLRQAFGWNNLAEYYVHYAKCGKREGRKATGCDTLQNPIHTCFSQDLSSVYDYYYYINKYPDVKAAFNGDDLATFIHFATAGTSEGRQGSEGFNVEVYANNNPDLFMAFGFDLPRYYIHYATCGKNEGRIAV